PAETEQEIIAIVKSVPNVSDPHNLRTRRLGNRIAIEMHVRMTGSTTLAEAHQHASLIEQRLRERFGATTHINIHMEPEK
ncbi:MAG: cation-efflux pump, partial [Paludibacteraceae bacterium]|nr:cation-efflux pump [Paludibacteraceae bacterium]